MGHRALIAYERPDESYNLHYSHWGASNLRLKHGITPDTPFGGEEPNTSVQGLFTALTETDETEADQLLEDTELPSPDVDIEPRTLGVSFEEACREWLDFLHHEAFYVVDRAFELTAYRTLWFGLQYDCRSIDHSETIGNGALRTVRWYQGEPVGDGFTRGQFKALKDVTGDMIDRGVFAHSFAVEYMERKVKNWTESEELVFVY